MAGSHPMRWDCTPTRQSRYSAVRCSSARKMECSPAKLNGCSAAREGHAGARMRDCSLARRRHYSPARKRDCLLAGKMYHSREGRTDCSYGTRRDCHENCLIRVRHGHAESRDRHFTGNSLINFAKSRQVRLNLAHPPKCERNCSI